MPATVEVVRLTGAGPTVTTVTSVNTRASTSDAPSPGSANPIPVPGAGSNYSFWVTTRLNCTVAPATNISNLRFFTDGSNGFGTGVTALAQSASSYVQATGTTGATGDQLSQGNHAGLTDAPVSPFTWTSGSPKSLNGSTSTTGQFGDYMVMQLVVGTTAGPGTVPAETFSFSYDET